MRYSAEDQVILGERFAASPSERELKNKERRAFDSADVDGDGYIDRDQVVVLLKILGEPSNAYMVEQLFKGHQNFINYE